MRSGKRATDPGDWTVLKMQRRNQRAFFLNELGTSFAGCFLSESYVQAYLLLLGLSVGQISLYGSVSYGAALISYVTFWLFKPVDGSYFAMYSLSSFPLLMLPLALCLVPGLSWRFPLILVAVFIYQFCGGLRSASMFTVVPTLFPRRHYGPLLAKCSTIGCSLGALISITNALFVKEQSMTSDSLLFALSACLYLAAALFIRLMRPGAPEDEETRLRHAGLRASLTPQNLWLLTPHLLRGIAMGGYYYFVVASFSRLTLPAALQPLMVATGVCGSVFGVFMFGRLDQRLKTGDQIFIANILCALCGVLSALNRSPALFFVLYFAYMSTNNLTANAVPAGVIYSTPMESLPFISSMRMLVLSSASCLTIPAWGWLLNALPAWSVMLLCAGVHIATGAIFRLQYRDPLK